MIVSERTHRQAETDLEQRSDSVGGDTSISIRYQSFEIDIAGGNAFRVRECQGGQCACGREFQNGFR